MMQQRQANLRWTKESRHGRDRTRRKNNHQRRAYVACCWCCCILAGEIDSGGGEATRIPVLGLTIGIALRVRRADGW